MTEEELDRSLGIILARWRTERKMPQSYMADIFGCSRRTITSIENGETHAKFFTAYKWAEITKHDVESVAQELRGIKATDKDHILLEHLINRIRALTPEMIRCLSFIFFADHGGNLRAVLNLFVAYLKCPMRDRQNLTLMVLNCYDLAEARKETVCPDGYKPNIELLRSAQELGKQASISNDTRYYMGEKNAEVRTRQDNRVSQKKQGGRPEHDG